MTAAIILCTINGIVAMWIATAAFQRSVRTERRAAKHAALQRSWTYANFQRKDKPAFTPKPHKTWNKQKGQFEQ